MGQLTFRYWLNKKSLPTAMVSSSALAQTHSHSDRLKFVEMQFYSLWEQDQRVKPQTPSLTGRNTQNRTLQTESASFFKGVVGS